MRPNLLLGLFCFLIATLSSFSNASSLTFSEARHLLARTGFGVVSPKEIKKFLPLSYEDAVDEILSGVREVSVQSAPVFKANPLERRTVRDMDGPTRQAFNKRIKEDHHTLRNWWNREMLITPSPFTERMVLFWHNHFVSEASKVRFGKWLYDQNTTFRKHATGDFRQLLTDISIGPAMLIYLDANKNKKNNPNENFAREILELFTLGEGDQYTEDDIRESARAYTGWMVNPFTAKFEFNIRTHDGHIKTFMGEEGNFDGKDIIRIILKKPEVGDFLALKLWKEFISLEVDTSEVKRLGKILFENNFALKPMLRELFLTEQFRNPQIRGTLIKSPVELTLGTIRLLGNSNLDFRRLIYFQRSMGQNLFQPPDVRGWRGGTNWITSSTILTREKFLKKVFQGVVNSKINMTKNMNRDKKLPFMDVDFSPLLASEKREEGYLKKVFLAANSVTDKRQHGARLKTIRNLILDPAYQVK